MQQNFRTIDIQGFSPAVEPTQSKEMFILDGKNYIFDTRGPKSHFGSRFLLPEALMAPQHFQSFRVKGRPTDRVFSIVSTAIMEWDESQGGWVVLYLTPDTTVTPYRWTWGYLAGQLFFNHPAVGTLVYNFDSRYFAKHNPPGYPQYPIAISVSNGVLGVIDDEFLYWSAPSDGFNFTPQLGGAGAQKISDSINGEPIMLSAYSGGFMTWTTGGIMRSEWNGTSIVFKHRPLETEFRPINSFCLSRLDKDTTLILDQRGLFVTKGDAPTPYAPLFNEFLLQYIYDNPIFAENNNCRLEWDDQTRMLYVSMSSSALPIYEQAFALYANLDKWGQFSELHYGIGPIRMGGLRPENAFGYVDAGGRINYWASTGSREVFPTVPPYGDFLYPRIQNPAAQMIDGAWNSSSHAVMYQLNPATTGGRANFYAPDSMTGVPPTLTGLNSMIRFGLFRPNGDTVTDEMSEIVNVQVRSVKSGDPDTLREDYNLIPSGTSDEDYNLLAGTEDFGFAPLNYVNHGMTLIGTLDGDSEFMSQDPELVEFNRAGRLYSCSVVGIWHIMELRATEVGESYHPLTFEITATAAGRLL